MATGDNQTTIPPDHICAAMRIMGRLICCIPERDRDDSAVFDAVMWIHRHHPQNVWLPVSVHELMERTVEEVSNAQS